MKNLLPIHPSHEFVCCNFIFSYKGFLSGKWKGSQIIPRIRWIRAILGSSYHPAKTQRLAGERLFLSANPKNNLRFSARSVSSLPLLHPTLAVLGERARMFPSPTPRLLSSLVYNLPLLILSLMSHQDIPWDLTWPFMWLWCLILQRQFQVFSNNSCPLNVKIGTI